MPGKAAKIAQTKLILQRVKFSYQLKELRYYSFILCDKEF